MQGRVGQDDLGLRHADQRHGLRRRHSGLKNRGLSHPNILARQNHQPPRDEPRILPRLQHAREIVNRGVGVTPPHALDEGAHDVVVLVAVLVIAERCMLDSPFNVLDLK